MGQRIKGLNQFKTVDVQSLMDAYQCQLLTIYPANGCIRLLVEITDEGVNEGHFFYIDIDDAKTDDIPMALYHGTYPVTYRQLIGVTQVSEVYNSLYVHVQGVIFDTPDGKLTVGQTQSFATEQPRDSTQQMMNG